MTIGKCKKVLSPNLAWSFYSYNDKAFGAIDLVRNMPSLVVHFNARGDCSGDDVDIHCQLSRGQVSKPQAPHSSMARLLCWLGQCDFLCTRRDVPSVCIPAVRQSSHR